MHTVLSLTSDFFCFVKVGTPICIEQSLVDIGRIASIKNNDKPVDSAKKGQKVSIKIVRSNTEEQQKMFGRHFEIEVVLVSKTSRRSIDILRTDYRKDLSIEDWKLVKIQKALFKGRLRFMPVGSRRQDDDQR
ncbi:hypothetical protein K7X08_025217 [Anisodus acutangulus]|uniref:Elongation factor Tu-type domain-containing protein n=1 Tax=Anisodus acutangulus TaxID=402998 RepID=A0A9Q1M9E2_9SOLA|nr:hypothetical protein K7X08_025217 [Anisodus acutangulus]